MFLLKSSFSGVCVCVFVCEGQRRMTQISNRNTCCSSVSFGCRKVITHTHTHTHTHTQTHTHTHTPMIWLWGRRCLVIPFSLVRMKMVCTHVCMCVCLSSYLCVDHVIAPALWGLPALWGHFSKLHNVWGLDFVLEFGLALGLGWGIYF